MSIVVVAILIVLWAWILVPGAVRERRRSSPVTSVSRFERSMAQLARANPAHSLTDATGGVRRFVVDDRPESPGAVRAARRRRRVLTGLTTSTTVWLVIANFVGGVLWGVFGLSALLLATYVVLLAHRWIRVSQEEATPLVPPAETPLAFAPTWEGSRQALRPADAADDDAGRDEGPARGPLSPPVKQAGATARTLPGAQALRSWADGFDPAADAEAVRPVGS